MARCTQLDVTVAKDALSAGQPEVVAENPLPAGCTAASTTVLTVPPTPAIADASPRNVCRNASGNVAVTLSGQGFLRTDSADFSLGISAATHRPDSI